MFNKFLIMERSVKFRLLAEQLSGKEFDLFLLNLHKSQGKLLLISAVFTYFNKNNHDIDQVTKIISSILKSRKDKKLQPS